MSVEPPIALTYARLAVVLATTACLALALTPDGPLGIWPGTALAGGVGLSGAWFTARRELAPLLRPGVQQVAIGLALGALMAAATHLLYVPLAARVPGVAAQVAALYAIFDVAPGRGAVLPIVLVVVTAEELVWRGLTYGWLRTRLAPVGAIGCATALYAVPQLAGPSWVLLVAALGCGAVWTAQRALFGSLVVPLCTHLTWDLLVMGLFPLT